MGEQRHPGQSGSPSSYSDAIANPDTEANPNPNATTHPAADALANATAHPAANASAHPIAASNTVPASYRVALGLTNAGANGGTLADPCPSAGAHGKPHGSPTRATSGCRRPQRGRPPVYGRGARWISSGDRDRALPAGRSHCGRLGNSRRFAKSLPAFHAGDHGDPDPVDDDASRNSSDAALKPSPFAPTLRSLTQRYLRTTLCPVVRCPGRRGL
jgi:hypothetical protein